MRMIPILSMLFFVTAVCGCMGQNAGELFETAEFEMLQGNLEHATVLYEEIVQKYPDTEYAAKAAARLQEIKTKPRRHPSHQDPKA